MDRRLFGAPLISQFWKLTFSFSTNPTKEVLSISTGCPCRS